VLNGYLRTMTAIVARMLKAMLATTTTRTDKIATFGWPAPSSLPTRILCNIS
jgi:hypothetical protein